MPSDPHEEFRELCALSTTGELTEGEWSRLNDHLAHCDECRELKSQYDELVTTGLPAMAAEQASSEVGNRARAPWSLDEAEARLMESLREPPRTPDNLIVLSHSSGRNHVRRYAVAAMILGGCTIAAYQIGVHRPKPETAVETRISPRPNKQPQLDPSETTAPSPVETRARAEDEENSRLRGQIRSRQLEITNLQEELLRAEEESAERAADLDRSRQDRTELGRELAEAQGRLASSEQRLSAVGNQTSQQTVELLGLKTQIGDLNAAVAEKDKEIAREQELLMRDRDIRNLIGARDLYIAEIYDVAKTGDTEKPFGRIFYTKNKSLVFYGYDLDQQKGLRKDASFQAWGRRTAGAEKDVSLGLLYQDESGKNRWVLKFNDARTIQQIDAVFITAEPGGGSSKPTGKPLLFTYLRLDPNHP